MSQHDCPSNPCQICTFNAQFNIDKGEALKEAGVALASNKRSAELEIAQAVARDIAKSAADNTCTADQVQAVLLSRGINLGNAAGAIFKGRNWTMVGVKKSARVSNHARILRIWKLVA